MFGHYNYRITWKEMVDLVAQKKEIVVILKFILDII